MEDAESYVRLFSFPGFVDSPPPWSNDNHAHPDKAMAVLLQKQYSDSPVLKRRLWVNLVVLFRALVHFSPLLFDRDFYKMVNGACHFASMNTSIVKDLSAYWSRRRHDYLKANGKKGATPLLAELVDTWQAQYNRNRERKLEYLPNVSYVIGQKKHDWADKLRDLDVLLDSKNGADDILWRHPPSPPNGLSRRNSIHNAGFGRKRSVSPKRESEEYCPPSPKRRRPNAVGGLTSPALSIRGMAQTQDPVQGPTPVTPSNPRQIEDLDLDTAQSLEHDNEAVSHANSPTVARSAGPDHIPNLSSDDTREALSNEVASLKGRLTTLEGKVRILPSTHAVFKEQLQTQHEELAVSFRQLKQQLDSFKSESDSKLSKYDTVSKTLRNEHAMNKETIGSLRSTVKMLEHYSQDIEAASAITATTPVLDEMKIANFRQVYLRQPGLASVVLLTESCLSQLESRLQKADERIKQAEAASKQQPHASEQAEKIARLEQQIALVAHQGSVTQGDMRDQATQHQQQSLQQSAVIAETQKTLRRQAEQLIQQTTALAELQRINQVQAAQLQQLNAMVAENHRLIQSQAEQAQRQEAVIKEMQAKQAAHHQDVEQQFGTINVAMANQSTNIGLQSSMKMALDLARAYHKNEHFVNRMQTEQSARMVVSLEAALKHLDNSKV